MATIDELSIQINASSQQAYTKIEALAKRLDTLSGSLQNIEVGKLTDLANSMSTFAQAIASVSASTKMADYTRLAKGLSRIASVDAQSIVNTANALSNLAGSISSSSAAVSQSDSVITIASAISNLGRANVTKAINNMPLLATAYRNLIDTIATAPNVSENIIRFTNSLSNLANQGQRVGSAADTMQRHLIRSSTATRNHIRHTRSLASAIGRLYANFFLAIRGAKAWANSIKGTADYIESFNYFNVAFGKIADEWRFQFRDYGYESATEYADSFTKRMNEKLGKMSGIRVNEDKNLIETTNQKNLGLNLTELTQYASSIASITNAIGQTGEVSLATSKALTMLAADMGSLKNDDFKNVSKNFQSAMTGQARAVYKYGIDVTNATLEQYAYAQGIEKSVSEMSQSEKMQLRLLAMLDQSKVAWGDLANTIDSPSNALRQFKNNLSEIGTVFGQLFIPMLNKVLPVINGVSIAIKNLLVDVAQMLGIQIDFDAFSEGYVDATDEITDSLDDLSASAKEAKKSIRAFDELNVISSSRGKNGGELDNQIDLSKQILEAVGEYEKVWEEAYARMKSKAQEYAENISKALEPIKNIIEDFHVGDFFKAGEDVSDLVISIEKFISDAINSVDWKGIGTKIGNFIKGIKWKEVLEGLADIIGSAIQGLFNLWSGSFNVAPFETALITAFAAMRLLGLTPVLRNMLGNQISRALSRISSNDLRGSLQRIGIGAISLGVGVALNIDSWKAIATGEETKSSMKTIIKELLGSAAMGLGGSVMASAIGVSGGLGFVVMFSVGLILNLVADLVMDETGPTTQLEQKINAWTQESHQATIDLLVDVDADINEVNTTNARIEEVAQTVFDLSQKYDTLTNKEKALLKVYSDELVRACPDIKDSIDSITGAYNGTWEALDNLIKKTKEYALQQAYSNKISSLFNAKIDKQDEVEQMRKRYEERKGKRDELREALKKEIASYGNYQRTDDNEKFFDMMVDKALGEFLKGDTFNINNHAISADDFKDILGSDGLNAYYDFQTSLGKDYAALQTLEGDVVAIDKKIDELTNDYAESVMRLNTLLETGLDDADKTTKEKSASIISSLEDIRDNINGIFKNAGDEQKVDIYFMIEEIISSIESGVDPTKEQMQALWDAINAEVSTESVSGEVKQMMTDIATDINSGKPEAVSAMASLMQSLKEAVDPEKVGVKGWFTELAKDIPAGLVKGIEEGKSKFEAKLKELGLGGNKVFAETEEIHSPSKVFERFGKFIVEGLAIGVDKNAFTVENAISGLTDSMNDTIGSSTLKVNTPTLNMSTPTMANNAYPMNNKAIGDEISKIASNSTTSNNTEVVFRIEGDPFGMFKVIREENDIFRNQNGRSAFA